MSKTLVLVQGAAFVLVMAAALPVYAGTAIEKPSFTATPAELLAAAKAAPGGDWPAVILREEHETSFDDQGRATKRWRSVFVVRTQVGVDEWGTLSNEWSPFYQDKPTVRVRVIAPDATQSELDRSLITDAPAVETSPTVFSDRRRLQTPLPRLQIGAVVEEEVITKDRQPLIPAGSLATVWLGRDVPVSSTSITLSAPAARKARQISKGLDPKVRPRHEVKGGRESWTFDIPALPADPEWEGWVPGDVITDPYVGITTAITWTAVVASYKQLVDQRIADGPIALPPELPKTATLETARAIVAWLHRQVRYTGIEFGESSNVPWPPAETVKRGFGDCKDKATLLIALLRQAGIRADLALLSDGPGRDVDADLPGMGVFDHAIVRAQIGAQELWIDATEDLVPVGKLPLRDQGRRALVIAADATALTPTPRSTDNVIREVRTFELAETGAAKVTEVSRSGGTWEPEMRSWIRDTRADDVRKNLTEYVESELKAKKLERYASSPATDLATPFELTTVATEAMVAFTARDRIDVYLDPDDTLERVPSMLRREPDTGAPPRKYDFEWPAPFAHEIENRLVLPPGYSAPALAPDQTRKLGTATFTERRRLDGQTLSITFRFESGKQRLTPAELTALRTELRALAKEEVHLVLEHTGWSLADRGKGREAIAEVERLIKLHPKEAIHQTQLAFVLLESGAGAAARRAARKAVELEPKNADAYAMLAWVLKHDTLGRDYGFDWDRAGALAAYEKARKLDPAHVGAAVDHATLLEREPDGPSPGANPDLGAAAEAWKAARVLDDTADNAQALVRVLLRQGNGKEAEKVARAQAASEKRDTLLVAATALASGAPAAIGVASSLRTGAGRTTLLDTAAATLLLLRHYDASRALYAETGSIRTGTAQGMMVQKIARRDAKFAVGKDPAKTAIDVMLGLLDRSYVSQSMWDDDVRDALTVRSSAHLKSLAPLRKLARAYIYDIAQSTGEIRVEGKPAGPWRVECDFFSQKFWLYAILDKGAAKVIGAPDAPRGVGRYALRQLAAGDLATARQLLDWLRSDLDRLPSAATTKPQLVKLWGPGLAQDATAAALAAAVVADGGEPDRAIPILTKCATTAADPRSLCDPALAGALYNAKRWVELDAQGTEWEARDPDALGAALLRAAALTKLRRFDDAEKVLAATLAKRPDDRFAVGAQIQNSIARGAYDEALRRQDALAKLSTATAMDRNNVAWFRVATGKDLPLALELARAATRDVTTPNDAALNTLAVVEAELGDVDAAKADLFRSMEAGNRRIPEPADWYLIGRIHEQLGFRDDAIAAYKRVPADPDRLFPTPADLAKNRLKALGVR
jgi:tetratricopeptide (TPR) repeat protein